MNLADITTAIANVSLYRSLNHRFLDDTDDRQRHITFRCMRADDMLEWLFDATNAPDRYLDSEQMFVRQTFADAKLHSISRGDIIAIDGTLYKCKMVGWERVETVNDCLE